MEIKVVKQEQISPYIERWQVELPKSRFMEFGFFLEAMEGVGLHKRSFETENLMEVDVSIDFKQDLLNLIADLQTYS